MPRVKEKKQKRSYKKGLVLAALVLAMVGAVITFAELGSPSEGVVYNPSPQADIKPQADSWKIQTGKYIAFSYPTSFSALKTDKPSGIELESFKYVRRPSPFWYLSIGVSNLPSGDIKDNGSYNMRSLNGALYKHERWNINGSQVDVFSTLDGTYDKAVFAAHGSKALSVDLNSIDIPHAEKLDAIIKQVMASVRWVN